MVCGAQEFISHGSGIWAAHSHSAGRFGFGESPFPRRGASSHSPSKLVGFRRAHLSSSCIFSPFLLSWRRGQGSVSGLCSSCCPHDLITTQGPPPADTIALGVKMSLLAFGSRGPIPRAWQCRSDLLLLHTFGVWPKAGLL